MLIYTFCDFAYCKYFHQGQYQVTNSLNSGCTGMTISHRFGQPAPIHYYSEYTL